MTSVVRSHNAEHLHHEGGADVTEDHRGHEDAEGAAEEQADDAVDLSQEFGAHELREHLEGIERELDTADGSGEVRLHVGVLTSQTQRLLLGHSHREDSKVDAENNLLAILLSEQVEAVVVAAELKFGAGRHLLLEEGVIVLLVQNYGLLSQANVLEDLIKIERPLANVVIGLEQVEVPGLHHEEEGVFAGRLHVEHNTIVPGALAT